jgi:hypothetical protein
MLDGKNEIRQLMNVVMIVGKRFYLFQKLEKTKNPFSDIFAAPMKKHKG